MRIDTESDIDDLSRRSKLLAILSAWTELGLWDVLAASEGPIELSALPADTRALELTAPAVAHAGLLTLAKGRIKLSAIGRQLVDEDAMPTGRNFDFLGDLSRMADVLRNGGPVRGPNGEPRVTTGGVLPKDRERSKRFLDMLARRSAQSASECALWLRQLLPEAKTLLDVGGGHGRYGEAFAEQGFHVTLLDLPVVVDIARETHGDRFTYLAADFTTDDLGGPYDVAFLSNIVHGESDASCAQLLARISLALSAGGAVMLKDMFIDELGLHPEHAVFFSPTMLYYTREGRSHTIEAANRWAADAGLERPELIACDRYQMVLARKPLEGSS